MNGDSPHSGDRGRRGKQREWLLFLFLIVVLFPLLTILIVGGYGMAVWILQMIFGPPGPPA